MNTGRTIFSQIMDYLPAYEFRQCVERYSGNYKIKSFSCWDQFLSMAFAQFTYRESLRDIQACLRAAKQKTYHMGIRGKDFPQHTGPCQSDKRLAHLRRLCSDTHQESQITLCRRFIWHRAGTNHLRAGCHNHRSLPISLSVGGIPQAQGSGETAYASRFAWQHSDGSFHYQRESSRSQHPRQTIHRSRRDLYYGSRLSGFRSSLQDPSISSIFCNASQKQLQFSTTLFAKDRQSIGTQMRSGHYSACLLLQERLSGETQANNLLRRETKQETGFPDQQLYLACSDYHGALSQTLADRVVLQMDQAASANKSILWNIRKCGQDANMDCHHHLCAGSYHQKAIEVETESLHNFTDCKRNAVRENAAIAGAYRCRSRRTRCINL